MTVEEDTEESRRLVLAKMRAELRKAEAEAEAAEIQRDWIRRAAAESDTSGALIKKWSSS